MKKSWTTFFLLSLLLVQSTLGLSQAENLLPGPVASTPLERYVSDLLKIHSFYTYTKEDRINSLRELITKIKKNYALYEIKQVRLKLEVENFFAESIKREQNTVEYNLPELKALSNLQFLDRARYLVAKFQDGHLNLQANQKMPHLYNGLDLRALKDQNNPKQTLFYVVGYSQKAMLYQAKLFEDDGDETNDLYRRISNGLEVTAINGRPPQELVNEIQNYVYGSSTGSRETDATQALTWRNFHYPEENYDTYTFRQDDGQSFDLRLHWFSRYNSYRPDAQFLFALRGYLDAKKMQLDWQTKEDGTLVLNRSNSSFVGYDTEAAPQGLIDEENWYDEDESLALQFGYLLRSGKSYCYLRHQTFSAEKVYDSTEENATEKDFLDVLKSSLEMCESTSSPLILDLRYNGGGMMNYAFASFEYLTPIESRQKAVHGAFRITPLTQQFIYSWDDDLFMNVGEDYRRVTIEAFQRSVQDGLKHSYTYPKKDFSDEQPAFSGKMVALLGPECGSSCDIMSILLKENGRGTLLGQSPQGMGAGYWTNDDFDSANGWKDSLEIFELRIPNTLFGYSVPQVLSEEEQKNAYLTYNAENRPVAVDVDYLPTLEDYLEKDRGLIKKAIELLDQTTN